MRLSLERCLEVRAFLVQVVALFPFRVFSTFLNVNGVSHVTFYSDNFTALVTAFGATVPSGKCDARK